MQVEEAEKAEMEQEQHLVHELKEQGKRERDQKLEEQEAAV